uniref:DNA topoisomerase (ATP-hydrolyzing) n=1 Tax=viral metagenome TaxID=1070528 RepID=A0A6C0DMB8_9ZZZZ
MASNETDKKYKKHELRTHIYSRPSMYIGTIDPNTIDTYIIDDNDKIIKKLITFIPGLFKIFDEAVVNAIDHSVRTRKDNTNVVKNIKITIDKSTGLIEIYNDGMGIEIIKHTDYDLWIPELIFGELLTSSNYDDDEVRIVGGVNGLGIKLTNIFSKIFTIETIDSTRKKIYKQVFKENLTVKEVPDIKSCAKKSYTKITFLPDYEKFGLTGLTDDIYNLFKRRVYDVSACTDAAVSVYFNDKKIPVKDFEKYTDLFLETKTLQPRFYEMPNDRWEVVVAVSSTGNYEQMSFVNGINTIRGGRHVEYITNAITKKLTDMALTKKKKTIKPQHIKENLFIFVKSTIENPTFDSQTKETLTTLITKFGSKCELSDKFYDKLYKSGIIEMALSATEVVEQKKLTKTDGKKVNKIIVPKLDDANLAGTKDSKDCTLILTEGDSAKTMAISGLSVVGRDKFGVYPLKGKIINVKDITLQKITENNEITNLKKILGLEQNKDYSNSIDTLRYGKIMIMTDQDHDGSHIKGLLFNVFQTLWNSLYKCEGFITSMLTPIIKATNNTTKEVISFYNMSDYERWCDTVDKKSIWKIKYYKGLGTSTDQEAKEYFKEMKQITYNYTDKCDSSIDLAFNKKRADDRKSWLSQYDKNNVLDYTEKTISYETFINKDLIHFSNRNLERSIPHICDGLKESTRKILYACLKRNLYTNEIKVAQLAGNVSEVTAYHHGENSLQEAIIGMAQIFVGTNNINLLEPKGQMGSRISGGQDASSPRYIYTLLSKLTKLIFKEEDNTILNYLDEDGLSIEPEYYVPIIPMILVNGGIGIGTGYSTNIAQYNPSDIISTCLKIINNITTNIGKVLNKNDINKSIEITSDYEIDELIPYYLGFKGSIYKNDKGNYISKGNYKWIDDNTIEINELPVGVWTENYKEYLEELVVNNNHPYLKSFENHYTAKNVKFILKIADGCKKDLDDNKILSEFNLTSSKNLGLNNMHLFSEKGNIKKYNTTSAIIKEWFNTRIEKYYDRKEKQLSIMEDEFKVLSAKIRFIIDIIDGNIIIMNIKIKDIEDELLKKDYYKYNDSYDYLLRMPISHLTAEKKEALEKEVKTLKDKIDNLRDMSITAIWENELNELNIEWLNHKSIIEEDYLNDLKGGSATSSKPKRTYQKRK